MLLVNNVLTETACTYYVGGVSEPAEQVQQDSEAVAQDGDPPPGMCVCVRMRMGYWGEGKREVGMAYVRSSCARLPQYHCRLRL